MTRAPRQLLIDGSTAPCITGGGYLPSVILDRSISRAWATVVAHFTRPGDVVVDLTYRDSEWDEFLELSPRRVVRLDLDPSLRKVDARADWRIVPLRSGVAMLCLWDTPWNLDAGKDGDARRRYTAPYKHVHEILADMEPEEWARVVRPRGYFVARTMNFFHAGKFVDLRGAVARDMRARGPWEPWGEVLVEVGGRAPNHPMREDRPTVTTRHSYFTIFKRTNAKTKVRQFI